MSKEGRWLAEQHARARPFTKLPREAFPLMKRSSFVLVPVLVLVNSAAVWGQTEWARENIVPQGWTFRAGLLLALGCAAALELTGVLLAMEADRADDNKVPSGGIRMMSYGVGLVSGGLNLSHWGVGAAGIAFGFLSTLSPFLWGIHSRVSKSRAVAPSRRFWHPLRSISLLRFAAWEGISNEEEALLRFQEKGAEISGDTPAREMLPIGDAPETEEIFSLMESRSTGNGKLSSPPLLPIGDAPETVEEIRPISPPRPRAPRISWDAPKLIDMLLLGTPKAEILAATNVSLSSYGRISKVLRMLQEDRSTPIDAAREKVSPEHIDMMRRALAR
jgi:hypothetical protein